MRTLVFIAFGLALLALAAAVAPKRHRAWVALAFVALWLAVSGANLALGLSRGYSLQEELLIHLFLFGIPAGMALWLWRRSVSRSPASE